MVKRIAIALILALFMCSGTIAEEYRFEGEWYIGTYDTSFYTMAKKDDAGNISDMQGNSPLYCADGTIQNGEEKIDCFGYSDPSNIISLYARIGEDGLDHMKQFETDFFWKKSDGEYLHYLNVELSGPYLAVNGNIIPKYNADGDTITYAHIENKLYLIFENEYEGGMILPFGEDAFVLDIDRGMPSNSGLFRQMNLIFVRSSALK